MKKQKLFFIIILSLLASCSLFDATDNESKTWPVVENCDTIGVVDSFVNGNSKRSAAISVANDHGRLFAIGMKQLFWVNDSGSFEKVSNQQWQYEGGPYGTGPYFMDHPEGWKPQFFWFDDSLFISNDALQTWKFSDDFPVFRWWEWGATNSTIDDRVVALYSGSNTFVEYRRFGTVAIGDYSPSGEMTHRPIITSSEGRSGTSYCWLDHSMPFALGDTIYSDSCGHSLYAVNRNSAEVVHHPSPLADTNLVYFFPNAGRPCALHTTGVFCRNTTTGQWNQLGAGYSFKAYLEDAKASIKINGYTESGLATVLSLGGGSLFAVVKNDKVVVKEVSGGASDGDSPVHNMTIWNNRFVFTGNSGYILSLPLEEVLAWQD